jgi:hypothetical protein
VEQPFGAADAKNPTCRQHLPVKISGLILIDALSGPGLSKVI